MCVVDVCVCVSVQPDSATSLCEIVGVPPDRAITFNEFLRMMAVSLFEEGVRVCKLWDEKALAVSGASDNKSGGGADSQFTTDVFLGGACGKSTWRKAIAIPILNGTAPLSRSISSPVTSPLSSPTATSTSSSAASTPLPTSTAAAAVAPRPAVSYYDPQVESWTLELAVLEALVKARSKLLLFVLDAETRAFASMIEAAEFMAKQRQVVLVRVIGHCKQAFVFIH